MGALVEGDDGLPAEDVGPWALTKQGFLCRYIDITRAARAKFVGQGKAGATYIDLFCGPGRARIRRTGEWIDGSCVAAWKKSVNSGVPFSRIYIGDLDQVRLNSSYARLKNLGAPVETIHGSAADTVGAVIRVLSKGGLHFAFLDPYNLGALDFRIIKSLATLKRMDMLVHISKMDLQRNLGLNLRSSYVDFDLFAPGWKDVVNLTQSQIGIRKDIFSYWANLVRGLGVWPSSDMHLISGSKNQPLYWLLLAAKHNLAHKLWSSATQTAQRDLFK